MKLYNKSYNSKNGQTQNDKKWITLNNILK